MAPPFVPTAVRRVLLLNGPNLNLLGGRDPAVYGSETLADVERRVVDLGRTLGIEVTCAQSNSEGALIDLVHGARAGDGLILNPGAYAHYSYALRDAVDAVPIPCVEVHISNIHARESFRHGSVLAPVTSGFICGCGTLGYELALRVLADRIPDPTPAKGQPG